MPLLDPLAGLSAWALLPFVAFWLCVFLERLAPPHQSHPRDGTGEWVMNLAGLAMQGCVVPLAGYLIAVHVLAPTLAPISGVWAIGFWGAFLLNVLAVDLLYYVQHRAFHQRQLWPWHQAHHAAPRVSVWATSRNTIWTHFVFVYFLLNPWLAALTDSPEGFFAGAMLTAALDCWRHSRIDWAKLGLDGPLRIASLLIITPAAHHRHHADGLAVANFGANFSLWDRLFGTYAESHGLPERYQPQTSPTLWCQFWWPWRIRFAKKEKADVST